MTDGDDVKGLPDSFRTATLPSSAHDPALKGTIRNLTSRTIIADAAREVQNHISRQPHVQRLFSFMPTLMTRVSPFHLRGRISQKSWPLVRLSSGQSDFWGQMTVVGELLIIFDETVLFSLLALLKHFHNDAFQTSETDLCRLCGEKTTPAGKNAIWKSIQRLAGTRIDMSLWTGRGKKRKTSKQMTGTILTYCDRDVDTGVIRVVLNPYFLEMYGDSFVTNIDLSFRAALKADISKAFYRFLQGQAETVLTIETGNLAKAVNLNGQQDLAGIRRNIRKGLRELVEHKYLSGFEAVSTDVWRIEKTPGHDLGRKTLLTASEI